MEPAGAAALALDAQAQPGGSDALDVDRVLAVFAGGKAGENVRQVAADRGGRVDDAGAAVLVDIEPTFHAHA